MGVVAVHACVGRWVHGGEAAGRGRGVRQDHCGRRRGRGVRDAGQPGSDGLRYRTSKPRARRLCACGGAGVLRDGDGAGRGLLEPAVALLHPLRDRPPRHAPCLPCGAARAGACWEIEWVPPEPVEDRHPTRLVALRTGGAGGGQSKAGSTLRLLCVARAGRRRAPARRAGPTTDADILIHTYMYKSDSKRINSELSLGDGPFPSMYFDFLHDLGVCNRLFTADD